MQAVLPATWRRKKQQQLSALDNIKRPTEELILFMTHSLLLLYLLVCINIFFHSRETKSTVWINFSKRRTVLETVFIEVHKGTIDLSIMKRARVETDLIVCDHINGRIMPIWKENKNKFIKISGNLRWSMLKYKLKNPGAIIIWIHCFLIHNISALHTHTHTKNKW